MASVRVRNLEDWVVEALRSRARRKGHSLEGELRELLREEAMRPKQRFATELQELHADLQRRGVVTDAIGVLREDRDNRI